MKKYIVFLSSLFILVLLTFVFLFFIFPSMDSPKSDTEEFKSPSGNYILVQKEKKDNHNIDGYSFEIKSTQNSENIYINDDYFSKNSRFLLSWSDNEDIVWVYSGDVGLYYWTLNSKEKTWEKQQLNQNVENSPSLPKVFKEDLAESSISKILKENGQWK